MSKFTKTVKKVFEFEGDKVEFELKRMKRKDVVESLVAEGTNIEKANRVLGLLTAHVVTFRGLTDADGNEMTLEQAMDEQYFQPVVKAIVDELLDASKLSKEETGNSDASLPVPSKA